MPIIAQQVERESNLIKYEYAQEVGYCRADVTVNESAETEYLLGTALGRVTADGKYKISVETAVDGSEDVVALVVEPKTIAASTDTQVAVLIRGPAIVGTAGIKLDASYDNPTKVQAAYDSLESRNAPILVEESF